MAPKPVCSWEDATVRDSLNKADIDSCRVIYLRIRPFEGKDLGVYRLLKRRRGFLFSSNGWLGDGEVVMIKQRLHRRPEAPMVSLTENVWLRPVEFPGRHYSIVVDEIRVG